MTKRTPSLDTTLDLLTVVPEDVAGRFRSEAATVAAERRCVACGSGVPCNEHGVLAVDQGGWLWVRGTTTNASETTTEEEL